jgi:Cytochrome c554 and c-prime
MRRVGDHEMSWHLLRRLALAAPVLALGLAACEGCRSTGTPTTPPAAADIGPPTVRLYLVTDMAGALEPCGCTKDQLGGLDHFGAWVKSEQPHAPAAMVAAAGPLFFMDDKLEGDRADQDRIKADAIARVLHGAGLEAFAPGTNDWDDGPAGLDRLTHESGATAFGTDGSAVVRAVGGVRIGFVGYGQREQAPSTEGAAAAIKHGVEEARKQGAQVLVALAAVGRGEAKRIADSVPELTAIVVGAAHSTGDSNTAPPPAEQVGNVLVVQAANHLQSVAVLDLYVRETPAAGSLLQFADATGMEQARKRDELRARIDELHVKISAWERDPSVPAADVAARRQELAKLEGERDALDVKPPPAKGSFFRYRLQEMRKALGQDPAIEADMAAYYKAVQDHNRVAFADRVAPPAGPNEASYVGIETCATCHPAPRDVWSKTSHAHAYATLSKQFKELNLECVGCHVTGYEQPGGSTVTHVDRLEDVQCEVCHGPGSRHVQNPTDRTRIVASPSTAKCLECHHPPHVEQFDAAARMADILGPGHGRPLDKK